MIRPVDQRPDIGSTRAFLVNGRLYVRRQADLDRGGDAAFDVDAGQPVDRVPVGALTVVEMRR